MSKKNPVLKEFALLAVVGFVVFLGLSVFGLVRPRYFKSASETRFSQPALLVTCVVFLPLGVIAGRSKWSTMISGQV